MALKNVSSVRGRREFAAVATPRTVPAIAALPTLHQAVEVELIELLGTIAAGAERLRLDCHPAARYGLADTLDFLAMRVAKRFIASHPNEDLRPLPTGRPAGELVAAAPARITPDDFPLPASLSGVIQAFGITPGLTQGGDAAPAAIGTPAAA